MRTHKRSITQDEIPAPNQIYVITKARPTDIPFLANIELAAGTLLRGHAPDKILGETTSEVELERAQTNGQRRVEFAAIHFSSWCKTNFSERPRLQ